VKFLKCPPFATTLPRYDAKSDAAYTTRAVTAIKAKQEACKDSSGYWTSLNYYLDSDTKGGAQVENVSFFNYGVQ